MSELPVWNCEFQPLAGPEGGPLNALTVGTKFTWKCHGDLAVNWGPEPALLVFAKPEDQYTLAILQVVRQEPNDVQYVVTAYKAGEHIPDYVHVMQGLGQKDERGFEALKPKWQIKSVLDPKKPAQPVPPLGPFHLSLPLWFIIAFWAVLVLLVFECVRRVRKHLQRRRMLVDLERHKTALPPLHQFYRDARQIRRRIIAAKEPHELKTLSEDLNRDFRLLVLRQFQIPTLDWSDGAILRDLRKHHRAIYREAGGPLRKTLRELLQLKGRENIAVKDLEQLHRMSLDTAERLQATGGGK